MVLERGLPTVEVMIDGRGPFRFAIDTGAGGHGRISQALAASLGLSQSGEALAMNPSGGEPQRRAIFTARSLEIGAMRFENVTLASIPQQGGVGGQRDGILGLDLFGAVTVTMDYANGRLRLDREPVSGGVRYTLDAGAITVRLDVGGAAVDVHIDTGNAVSPLFLPEAQARALALSGEPREIVAQTSFGEVRIQQADISAPVRLGETLLPVRTVSWPPLRGIGNLGSQALAGMALRLDQRGGRLEIVPAGVSARDCG